MSLSPSTKHDKHHRTCQWTELCFDVKSNLVQDNSEKKPQSLLIKDLNMMTNNYEVVRNIIIGLGETFLVTCDLSPDLYRVKDAPLL